MTILAFRESTVVAISQNVFAVSKVKL